MADPKLARASAGALLLLSRRAQKRIKRATDAGVDEAVSAAARQRGTARKAAVLAAMMAASRSMSARVADAVVEGRRAARAGALVRASAELGAIGIAVSLDTPKARAAEDSVRGDAAGDAIAAAWRSSAVVAVSRAVRTERDLAAAVERTRRRLDARAVMTARSEVADAYNGEHAAALRDAVRADPELRVQLKAQGVVRVWHSVLEKNTCAACARHDGDTTGVGDDFGGDEPGEMHPSCLCTSYLSTE